MNKPFTVIVPAMLKLLLPVTPFVLLIVRLFKAVILDGMFTPTELPPNDNEEEEVVIKLVAVPAIVGPLKVNVFDPTVKVPLLKVKVPATLTSPPSVTPLALVIVRLL